VLTSIALNTSSTTAFSAIVASASEMSLAAVTTFVLFFCQCDLKFILLSITVFATELLILSSEELPLTVHLLSCYFVG